MARTRHPRRPLVAGALKDRDGRSTVGRDITGNPGSLEMAWGSPLGLNTKRVGPPLEIILGKNLPVRKCPCSFAPPPGSCSLPSRRPSVMPPPWWSRPGARPPTGRTWQASSRPPPRASSRATRSPLPSTAMRERGGVPRTDRRPSGGGPTSRSPSGSWPWNSTGSFRTASIAISSKPRGMAPPGPVPSTRRRASWALASTSCRRRLAPTCGRCGSRFSPAPAGPASVRPGSWRHPARRCPSSSPSPVKSALRASPSR